MFGKMKSMEKVYDYPKDCFNKNYYLDYNINTRQTEKASYISLYGYSSKKYECKYNNPHNKNIKKENIFLSENGNEEMMINEGGYYEPKNCNFTKKIAVIVPYRNRPKQLKIFLNQIHKFLTFQNINYQVFIIEQDKHNLFNRGFLLNIGFVEALKINSFDCLVFHDVDRIPKFVLNRYDCVSSPRHLSVQTDENIFMPQYNLYAGGVTSISVVDFSKTNGFSNIFWGWGGEDDDFYQRLLLHNLELKRVHLCLGQYNFIKIQHISQYRFDDI
ncbi:hypothetical protein HZS_1993, partial [Henneguya salminicola]